MKKIITGILRLQEALGTCLLAVFFLSILLQIGARYTGQALPWTEELAGYSFIWAVFMGASVMVHHRAHFSFSFFKDRFAGRGKALYDIGVSAVLLCFAVPMFCYGIAIVAAFWDYNWITIPWMRMGYTWLCIPAAGFTMSLYSLRHMASDWRLARGENEK